MRVSVRVPDEFTRAAEQCTFRDEVLLWCMETGIQADFYRFKTESSKSTGKALKILTFAVFIIEPDDEFLFNIRWDSARNRHKDKIK